MAETREGETSLPTYWELERQWTDCFTQVAILKEQAAKISKEMDIAWQREQERGKS